MPVLVCGDEKTGTLSVNYIELTAFLPLLCQRTLKLDKELAELEKKL